MVVLKWLLLTTSVMMPKCTVSLSLSLYIYIYIRGVDRRYTEGGRQGTEKYNTTHISQPAATTTALAARGVGGDRCHVLCVDGA